MGRLIERITHAWQPHKHPAREEARELGRLDPGLHPVDPRDPHGAPAHGPR